MKQKELIAPIFLKDGRAVRGFADDAAAAEASAVMLAGKYSNLGADAILLFDLSSGDAQHEKAIGVIKEIACAVDIPVYGGGNIHRMEDVKKLIYAGCRKVFLNYGKEENVELTHEVSGRFGQEKILACVRDIHGVQEAIVARQQLGGVIVLADFGGGLQECAELQDLKSRLVESFSGEKDGLKLYCAFSGEEVSGASAALDQDTDGIFCGAFMNPEFDFMEFKHGLKAAGISVNTYESSLAWEEIRTNSDGLLPVVVQDYKTQELLMVAYMNQEAFEQTVRTGRMTYWSRSRQELWVKGLTSGHFQYVKELCIDCDNDTLLAKVSQVGAACHTGNRSCFYRTILKKEYDETNPLKVFEDVFAVIQDRKLHPKEGSYTNYLFNKGIDKILKKIGEEATEIVIAAKNPDPEEIKYEISDFLYHVMVLMAERGVNWEDITKELARR